MLATNVGLPIYPSHICFHQVFNRNVNLAALLFLLMGRLDKFYSDVANSDVEMPYDDLFEATDTGGVFSMIFLCLAHSLRALRRRMMYGKWFKELGNKPKKFYLWLMITIMAR